MVEIPLPFKLFYRTLIIGKQNPVRTLFVFSMFGAIAMIVGICSTGLLSIFAFLSGGLFCSVLWPCIFTLAINKLQNYTAQASSFLIMMIIGGAILPPLQGFIADSFHIKFSYLVPCFAFLFLMFYSVLTKKNN